MKIHADMHVHSKFSIDAKAEIRAMCKSAIEKGLQYIAFTEHYDLNPRDSGFGFLDLDLFARTIDTVRDEFGDRLQVLKGLEFGEPHSYPGEFELILKQDFDIILGSVHMIDDIFIGEKSLADKYSREQIFERYYQEVLKTVKVGGFDVLAHLDFPKRYLKTAPNDLEVIDEILAELIKADIALEINTSPLRKGLTECTPDQDLLQKYFELGGAKITVGSDAHSTSEIAADFEYAGGLLVKNKQANAGIYWGRKFKKISTGN